MIRNKAGRNSSLYDTKKVLRVRKIERKYMNNLNTIEFMRYVKNCGSKFRLKRMITL